MSAMSDFDIWRQETAIRMMTAEECEETVLPGFPALPVDDSVTIKPPTELQITAKTLVDEWEQAVADDDLEREGDVATVMYQLLQKIADTR